MAYHVDRLFAAVSVMVTHGPVKQRLIKAYEDHLDAVEEDELPEEIRDSMSELHRRMYGVAPTNGEGRICASVRKMSKDEADYCARLIVTMYGVTARHSDEKDAQLADQVGDSGYVPPFLVKSG